MTLWAIFCLLLSCGSSGSGSHMQLALPTNPETAPDIAPIKAPSKTYNWIDLNKEHPIRETETYLNSNFFEKNAKQTKSKIKV